jgi:AAA15 family ATPase/GTPase
MEFLKGADTGIVKAVLGNVTPLAERATIQEQLQIFHRGVGGAERFLKLEDESHGTRRLLTLLGPIFAAIDQGKMVILDELDASMHSLLSIKLLHLFNSPQFNPKGAQLLFTTHDTNLLGRQVLRRDQIWFTEKDKEGATYLYPLTDIRTRQTDNLAEGYLQGRFGGVPWLGDLDFLPHFGGPRNQRRVNRWLNEKCPRRLL